MTTVFRDSSVIKMSDCTIRPATKDDTPALCALEKETFSLPWSEDAFLSFFENPCARAFVCEADGKTVGYITLYLTFDEAEIANLAVTASHRRRGIAGLLLDRAASLDGVTRLLLDVRESNTAARALYEKKGFTVDGIRRRFYEKPTEDAVLMSREIIKG